MREEIVTATGRMWVVRASPNSSLKLSFRMVPEIAVAEDHLCHDDGGAKKAGGLSSLDQQHIPKKKEIGPRFKHFIKKPSPGVGVQNLDQDWSQLRDGEKEKGDNTFMKQKTRIGSSKSVMGCMQSLNLSYASKEPDDDWSGILLLYDVAVSIRDNSLQIQKGTEIQTPSFSVEGETPMSQNAWDKRLSTEEVLSELILFESRKKHAQFDCQKLQRNGNNGVKRGFESEIKEEKDRMLKPRRK